VTKENVTFRKRNSALTNRRYSNRRSKTEPFSSLNIDAKSATRRGHQPSKLEQGRSYAVIKVMLNPSCSTRWYKTMKLTNGKIFLISMLVGIVYIMSSAWITRTHRQLPPERKVIRQIDSSGIYLTDQLWESDFPQVVGLHIATIVDLRPDGEAAEQTPSKRVAEISRQDGIAFEYIPIPHGEIPSAGVERLSSVLKKGKRPILLYCRTGKRALRTFCLAEAARKDGHSAKELDSIADMSGFDIKDLQPEIARRIAARRSK